MLCHVVSHGSCMPSYKDTQNCHVSVHTFQTGHDQSLWCCRQTDTSAGMSGARLHKLCVKWPSKCTAGWWMPAGTRAQHLNPINTSSSSFEATLQCVYSAVLCICKFLRWKVGIWLQCTLARTLVSWISLNQCDPLFPELFRIDVTLFSNLSAQSQNSAFALPHRKLARVWSAQ